MTDIFSVFLLTLGEKWFTSRVRYSTGVEQEN
jgi:hypothetical protein